MPSPTFKIDCNHSVTRDGYGGEQNLINEIACAPPAPPVESTLPVTGLEAGLVALFGLLLAGSGFLMRKVSRG